jgi:hypothetical protein
LQESMLQCHQFLLCLCTKKTHNIYFQVSEILNILGIYFNETACPIIFILLFPVCLLN